jgi:hypothetical protein
VKIEIYENHVPQGSDGAIIGKIILRKLTLEIKSSSKPAGYFQLNLMPIILA